MEGLNEVEEYLIRGMVYVMDVSGIGEWKKIKWNCISKNYNFAYLGASYLKIVPFENVLKISKNSEKCLAGRHKGFHLVNVPAALGYFLNLAIKHSTDKIRERVKIYSSFDQLDFIGKKSLPKEYGGTIPMKEMSSELIGRV